MSLLDQACMVFAYRVRGGMVEGVAASMASEDLFRIRAPVDFHTRPAIRYHFTDVIREAIRRGELD